MPLSHDAPDDISLCQTCNGLLRNPQMFPCFHAFCLECLDGLTQAAGTRVCCPLCNTAVIIASNGHGLGVATPGGVFLRKLLKLKEIFGSESAARSSACEVCNDDEICKNARTATTKMSVRYVQFL